MDTFLLTTKLRIPPQPHRTVPRARLIDTIECEAAHYKLILLSTPPGYGKTTLLSQWAHVSQFPIAWLSISKEDNDIERFFRYLLTAWEERQPSIRQSRLDLLLGAIMPDMQAVLSAFINVANDVPDHIVFVLDDYHLITERSIHQALTFLLDHLPPTLHFVLAGRAEPPLPLARYRTRHALLEFRAGDLQFLQEESSDFFNEIMRLDLAHDEVARLQAQLEGWIAGMQLVALSRQRHPPATHTLVVSGKHRFIADYLSEDVLAHLGHDTRRFLLQTSILERLCGPLCDAVTSGEASQEMLELLERDNLFLVPLDDSREWFRYHHLFADFLQRELRRRYPEEVADLHRRAARWYLAHDMPEHGFEHAVTGADAELAVQIVDTHIDVKLNSGELRVIEHWLKSIPREWYSSYPMLGLAKAGLLAYSGALDACARCIDDVEQRLASSESKQVRGQLARATAVRCALACFQNDLTQAEAFASQAIQHLSENDFFRGVIYGALGDTYRRNGRWQEARVCYRQALDAASGPALRIHMVHGFGALADLELQRGRLRDAAAYWSKALTGIQNRENWGTLPLPLTGWVYIRMAEILYEWNELEEAADHVSRGLERAELGGDVRALIAAHVIMGRLKLTEGDVVAAADSLERARPLVESAQFPDWIGRFERFQLECWLAQNRLRAAVDWADKMIGNAASEERSTSAETQLALVRLLISKGDTRSFERALALLGRLLQEAGAEDRTSVQIEALALQALAYSRRGEQAGALTALERALRLAEPEGYIRLFADLGPPMARLLQEAGSRAVLPEYIAKLLAACGGDRLSTVPKAAALPEPLTPREQEILELMAAGLTNREIADRLMISTETVKKHTGNIYSKLGVSNRTEAAARAREADLLA